MSDHKNSNEVNNDQEEVVESSQDIETKNVDSESDNSQESEPEDFGSEIVEELVDQSATEIALWKDQCKRISAEFENFKKRTQRDQSLCADRAKESVLKDLLLFVDDFERAMQQESSDNSGIEMVYQSLMKLLDKNGISAMTEHGSFDPEYHEAVMQVESVDHEPGQIVEVFSNGFMIQDRVFRPAKVSVSK